MPSVRVLLRCVLLRSVIVVLMVGTMAAGDSPCNMDSCAYTTLDIPHLKSGAPNSVILGSVYNNPFVDYLGLTRMAVQAVNNDPTILPNVKIELYLLLPPRYVFLR